MISAGVSRWWRPGGGAFVPLLGMRPGNYYRDGSLVEETEQRRNVALGREEDFKSASSGSPFKADLKKAKPDNLIDYPTRFYIISILSSLWPAT